MKEVCDEEEKACGLTNTRGSFCGKDILCDIFCAEKSQRFKEITTVVRKSKHEF
jgi:hypothetical protein